MTDSLGFIARELPRPQTPLKIGVCRFDQPSQRRGIDVTFSPELHVTHEPACPFQKPVGICDLGPPKEPDIDVSCEGIDIRECRIADTRGRVAIMKQLSNVLSA